MDKLSYLVSISWILFWLYWLISAIRSKIELRGNRFNSRWSQIIFFIVVAVSLLDSPAKLVGLNYQIDHHNPGLRALGVVLFYAGLALAVWARRHLGNSWGIPMSANRNAQLVTAGPYRLVRHPIYSGVLLAVLGSAFINDLSWLLFFVFAAAFAIFSSRQEEKLLARQFSKTYPAYKRRTKMLVPYIL